MMNKSVMGPFEDILGCGWIHNLNVVGKRMDIHSSHYVWGILCYGMPYDWAHTHTMSLLIIMIVFSSKHLSIARYREHMTRL